MRGSSVMVRVFLFGVCFGVSGVARAQTAVQQQADLTPWLVSQYVDDGVVESSIQMQPTSLDQSLTFSNTSDEFKLGCINLDDVDQPVNLLSFVLYSRNDGYADLEFNATDDPQFFQQVLLTQGYTYVLQQQSSSTPDFAKFTLVDAATGAVAKRITHAANTVPVTGVKGYFALANDADIPYRPEAANITGGAPAGTPIWGLSFIPGGRYDVYDWTNSFCQFVQTDGLIQTDASHDYDLIVEEDWPREMVCDPTNAASCSLDARMDDNVAALHITISTANGHQTATACDPADAACFKWLDPVPFGPSAVNSPPAVISRAVNTYDAFYVGTDTNLHALRRDTDGSWSNGGDLVIYDAVAAQSPLAGPLAAVSGDAARINMDVFARATNGDVVRVRYDGVTAQPAVVYGPSSQGLGTSAGVAAVASGPNSAMAVWMTFSRAVYGLYDGSNWSATPTALTGNIPGNQTPALTTSGNGVYHLFAKDGSGGVSYRRFANGAWTGWRSMGAPPGGAIVGNVTAASPYMNRADLFATAANHHVYHAVWYGTPGNDTFYATGNPAVNWTDDTQTARAIGQPTAISTGPRSMDVFFYDISHPTWTFRIHYDGSTVADDVFGRPVPWVVTGPTLLQSVFLNPSSSWPVVVSSWADHTMDLFQIYVTGQISDRALR